MSVLHSLWIKQGDLSRAVSAGNTAMAALSAYELGIRVSHALRDWPDADPQQPDAMRVDGEAGQSLRAIGVETERIVAAHRSRDLAKIEAAASRIQELLTTAETSWSKRAPHLEASASDSRQPEHPLHAPLRFLRLYCDLLTYTMPAVAGIAAKVDGL